MNNVERSTIAILVDNQNGVLQRIASLFTRRGFNIHSLAVSETENHKFSRITIAAEGDEPTRRQLIKQLYKLYPVHEVKVMERDEVVRRELALIKLRNNIKTRADIINAVEIFRCKIIDYSPNTLCVEITGDTSKIDAFITVVEPFGILEMCRTGVVALQRGCHYLNPEVKTLIEPEEPCKDEE